MIRVPARRPNIARRIKTSLSLPSSHREDKGPGSYPETPPPSPWHGEGERPRAARAGGEVKHLALLLLLAGLALSACQQQPAAPTVAVNTTAGVEAPADPPPTAAPTSTPEPEPVVVSVNLGTAPPTIDPALLGPLDSGGQDVAASVFAGLARLNPGTGRVEPYLAERWEQLEDGRTWRVYLRPDAAWVRLDAATGEVQRVRPVTAGDVVAAVQRACDPATGAPLGTRPGLFVIQGCEDVYLSDPAALPEGE